MKVLLPSAKILIRVPNWLGDNMMATPVVLAVRKTFPKAQLTILSKSNFVPLWKSFIEVHEVLVLEKGLGGIVRSIIEVKKRKFDMAITLPGSISSAFILFAAEVPIRIGWGGGRKRNLFNPGGTIA